jgi:hypothetical protein
MQTSRFFPALPRWIRTLGAQTSDADTHLAFLQGVNYDVHGRVGFVYKSAF